MATVVREIRFDERLLAELAARTGGTPDELSRVVNAAVDRYLRDGVAAPPPAAGAPAGLHDHAAAFRDALLDGDAARAGAVLDGALAAGADLVDVHCDVVAPALHDIGHGWALDEISVAEEHRATEIAVALLAQLAPDRRLPATTGRMAVVTGTPDELHVVGARMVGDLLERAGWEVVFLGAATPAGDLLDLAAQECPDLVAISTATAGRLPGVQEMLIGLAALDPRPAIVVGGALYTAEVAEFARSLGADLVANDLRELATFVRQRFP